MSPTVMPTQEVAERRFWAKVNKDGPTMPGMESPCWVWTGGLLRGYGQLTVMGRQLLAHRYSWELTHGPIPDGLWVLHRCDNPPCVNPAHHFLGGQKENMRDSAAKGRHKHQRHPELARGENNGLAKLTEQDVLQIRRLRRLGASRRVVAERFGITPQNVTHITLKHTWRHLEDH